MIFDIFLSFIVNFIHSKFLMTAIFISFILKIEKIAY